MRDKKQIQKREKSKNVYLYVRFTRETDDHEEQDGDNVVIEAGPIINFEGRHEGTHQHEKDRARSQDRTTCIFIVNRFKYHNLIKHMFSLRV